jgi:methylthioribulose-1-phosphate dehydratase
MAFSKSTAGARIARNPKPSGQRHFLELAKKLCGIGKDFYARGWAPGTGGNYSAVLQREPLQLAVTPSGVEKGSIGASEIVRVNHVGEVLAGKYRPSYETLVHCTIVRLRNAGAVLHTHSVWATILSAEYASEQGINVENYEMLKGLEGVSTHQHVEWVPIVQNCQDMVQLSNNVTAILGEYPQAHGFLVQGHGLYTWGRTLSEAKRHVEVFEFLFEVLGRTRARIITAGGNVNGGRHNS